MGRIKTLQTLDGQAVTHEEATNAAKNVVSSHLTMATLLGHVHTDVKPQPSLSVAPVAQTIHQYRSSFPLHISTASGTDFNKVA